MPETRELESDVLERSEADPRRLVVRLLRWGETARTPQGLERFRRGAFDDVDPSTVHLESQRHSGNTVGVLEDIEDRQDGPYAVFRVSDTAEGRDLLTLVADGVMRSASVRFHPVQTVKAAGGVLERVKAGLVSVAVVPRGAYASAGPTEVREMADEPVEQTTAPEPVVYDPQPVLDRMDGLEETMRRVEASAISGGTEAPTLDRFDSYGEAWLASLDDPDVNEALNRVLADQVSGDNPGLVDPANNIGRIVLPWVSARKSIMAFSGPIPLPPKGMTATWPAFDATSDFTVGLQSAEKAEVSTGTVKHTQESASILTYAGASDVSLQLLRRSDPSYRELLLREYGRQWGIATNAAFVAVLEASETTDTVVLPSADLPAALSAMRAALMAQSIAVEGASGVPASVCLASTTVFQRVAEASEENAYPVQNVEGVGSAATLSVNVGGISVIHEPAITAGDFITGEPQAAGWMEEGPFNISSLDVAKLGEDHAIYSFGVGALFREASVIVTTATLT